MHVRGVLQHGLQIINEVATTTNHLNLRLNARDWSQLEELVRILTPFEETTLETQGDKVCRLMTGLLSVVLK